ncbi:hypothetical protein COLO4_34972 [Corchorus olitorius]|uniref:HHO5-like N-terminal domain-containing protein n=1 Tax=Corchorus olitorius TaxID=93759 RepID=A0A1R3GIU8_9ROSI|nr:hypothetical protein COLO4_34972 [Corchorus olitorius]
MASPSELTLDCKPHSYSMLLKSFGENQQIDQTQKLEEFLSRLEEERLKIDAFKRELPLCMQLLTNAVESSRQQLQAYRANQGSIRPVLEEFIPLKNSSSDQNSDKGGQNISDKANWMTSAQLWSQAGNETKPQVPITSPKETTDIGFNVSPKLGLDTKQRNGGAFLPFSKDRSSNSSCPNSSALQALPDLALASANKDLDIHQDKKLCSETENGLSCQRRDNNGNKVGNNGGIVIDQQGKGNVATPKQIRELMKVEGLTNDEVKSHLQASYKETKPKSTSSRSPNAAACSSRRDMGSTGANSQAHSASPESDVRGAGDRSESIEDGKSESSSWKGESGDNGGGGERKGLAALREEGEESNGSEITLKF